MQLFLILSKDSCEDSWLWRKGRHGAATYESDLGDGDWLLAVADGDVLLARVALRLDPERRNLV